MIQIEGFAHPWTTVRSLKKFDIEEIKIYDELKL